MRNYFYLFIIIAFFFNSCKIDETIEEKYRQPFSHYSIGDTIFFKNNTKGLDTIRITSIDSLSNNGGLSYPAFKIIDLKIEHLPMNKWFSMRMYNESKGRLDTIQTDLIHLYKDQSWDKKSDKYRVYIGYRDFSGELDVDNLKERKIDTIKTLTRYSRHKLTDSSVVEVYWSYSEGLIGYKKFNGEVYHLVDR